MTALASARTASRTSTAVHAVTRRHDERAGGAVRSGAVAVLPAVLAILRAADGGQPARAPQHPAQQPGTLARWSIRSRRGNDQRVVRSAMSVCDPASRSTVSSRWTSDESAANRRNAHEGRGGAGDGARNRGVVRTAESGVTKASSAVAPPVALNTRKPAWPEVARERVHERGETRRELLPKATKV